MGDHSEGSYSLRRRVARDEPRLDKLIEPLMRNRVPVAITDVAVWANEPLGRSRDLVWVDPALGKFCIEIGKIVPPCVARGNFINGLLLFGGNERTVAVRPHPRRNANRAVGWTFGMLARETSVAFRQIIHEFLLFARKFALLT